MGQFRSSVEVDAILSMTDPESIRADPHIKTLYTSTRNPYANMRFPGPHPQAIASGSGWVVSTATTSPGPLLLWGHFPNRLVCIAPRPLICQFNGHFSMRSNRDRQIGVQLFKNGNPMQETIAWEVPKGPNDAVNLGFAAVEEAEDQDYFELYVQCDHPAGCNLEIIKGNVSIWSAVQ